jgi:hypothetical protein
MRCAPLNPSSSDRPWETLLGQQGGHPQGDGRVGVVPAGMHDARRVGSIGDWILLLDGQGIHIGADGDDGAAQASLTDHPRAPHARAHPVAKGL